MGDSDRCPWSLAVVTDAIEGIGRSHHLVGWALDAWRDAAWTMFFQRSDRLWCSFRHESSPRTYLGVTFARYFLNWATRELPKLRRTMSSIESLLEVSRPGAAQPFVDPIIAEENAQSARSVRDRLQRAWKSLGHAERELLFDYLVLERSMPEIAARLECSATAAHKRLHRALAELRALMDLSARPPARLNDHLCELVLSRATRREGVACAAGQIVDITATTMTLQLRERLRDRRHDWTWPPP